MFIDRWRYGKQVCVSIISMKKIKRFTPLPFPSVQHRNVVSLPRLSPHRFTTTEKSPLVVSPPLPIFTSSTQTASTHLIRARRLARGTFVCAGGEEKERKGKERKGKGHEKKGREGGFWVGLKEGREGGEGRVLDACMPSWIVVTVYK